MVELKFLVPPQETSERAGLGSRGSGFNGRARPGCSSMQAFPPRPSRCSNGSLLLLPASRLPPFAFEVRSPSGNASP